MAVAPSFVNGDRRARRRTETIDEALDFSVEIMTERGVGGLTLSEVARRMGMRQPSLYKYFPSLHAVYDELFGRAARSQLAAAVAATESLTPGIARLTAGALSVVQWSVENPELAQLMFWRPVPGFIPSAKSFAAAIESTNHARTEFAEAIEHGHLRPQTDLDEVFTLCTVVISGLVTQRRRRYRSGDCTNVHTRRVDTSTRDLDRRLHPRRQPPRNDVSRSARVPSGTISRRPAEHVRLDSVRRRRQKMPRSSVLTGRTPHSPARAAPPRPVRSRRSTSGHGDPQRTSPCSPQRRQGDAHKSFNPMRVPTFRAMHATSPGLRATRSQGTTPKPGRGR